MCFSNTTASPMVLLPDPQLRATRTRVGVNFFSSGSNDFPGKHLARSQRSERVLDDTVFKRVKRDDGKPPAGTKTVRRRGKEIAQIVQLTIHSDAQTLKRPRCRMNLSVPRRSENPLDGSRQVESGSQWARTNDRPGDRPRPALLAIHIEDVRDLLLAESIHNLGRRQRLTAIHTHVQISLTHKGKPPPGIVEHHRGDADVGQYPVRIQNTVTR